MEDVEADYKELMEKVGRVPSLSLLATRSLPTPVTPLLTSLWHSFAGERGG